MSVGAGTSVESAAITVSTNSWNIGRHRQQAHATGFLVESVTGGAVEQACLHEQVCAERGSVHSYASMRNRDCLIINKLIIC